MADPIKILGVDDEPDFELLITQRFRRHIRDREFAFQLAHHGEEALAMLDADPAIELMLLDINMPVMDGLTLLTHMRELRSSVSGRRQSERGATYLGTSPRTSRHYLPSATSRWAPCAGRMSRCCSPT